MSKTDTDLIQHVLEVLSFTDFYVISTVILKLVCAIFLKFIIYLI